MAIPAITNNSGYVGGVLQAVPGSISWAAFSIQYQGTPYAIAAGSSDQRWVWWRWNGGGANSVITSGPDLPQDLTDDDLVLFGNKNGIGVRIQSSTLIDGELIVDGSILAKAVSAEVMVANEIYSREGYFGAISVEQLQSGSISAAIALLGSLSVDNITISPVKGVPGDADYSPGGILIPQNTGGSILLPADGSPARFAGRVDTDELNVDGGMAINGLTNFINGKLVLGSGTPDPATPTSIGYALFTKTTKLGGNPGKDYSALSRGLAKTTDGHYATIVPYTSNGAKKWLRVYDPVTKNATDVTNSDIEELDMFGVTAIGNTLYVVGQRWDPAFARSDLRIHSYDTAGNRLTSRWITSGIGERYQNPLYWGLAIAADPGGAGYTPVSSPGLWIARLQSNNKIEFIHLPTTSGQVDDAIITPGQGSGGVEAFNLTGSMYAGVADFGDYRFVLGGSFDGGWKNAVFDYSGSGSLSGLEIPADTFGTVGVDGLIWDGTRFVTLDWDSTDAYLSNLNTNKTDVTVYAQHDWTNAAGTKRSKPSTPASRLIPRRTWPSLTVPAPPKTGSGTDIADRVNVYLDTDNVTKLLTTITTGKATTLIASAMTGTGIAPKLATDATDFTLADATGIMESVLKNISLKGDGTWKLGDLSGTPDGKLSFSQVTVVPATGATYTGAITFIRIGQVVHAFGYVDRAAGFNATLHAAGGITIPNGYRPAADVVGKAAPAWSPSGAGPLYRYRFNAAGDVQVQQSAAISVFQAVHEMWTVV